MSFLIEVDVLRETDGYFLRRKIFVLRGRLYLNLFLLLDINYVGTAWG